MVTNDLTEYWDIPQNKIFLVPIPPPRRSANAISDRKRFPEEFCLYPAVSWPHKNHKNLLQAWAILKNKGCTIPLVLTGAETAYTQELYKLVDELELNDLVFFHGHVSNNDLTWLLTEAKIVIIEINPNLPRTFGDVELHISAIDYIIPVNYPIPELPDGEITEKDLKIGNLIASKIHDGDCLQLGIGGIPNAVANALVHKKDLGVHTEMLTTGFMKLYQAGAITNKYKKTHKGKMVACFALGTRALYDFIDNNPSVLILDGSYVNDPYVIGLNDNQVSINSTMEVDLTGQCCSESIGSRQFSGTGGQSDTAVGAQISKGGRSFIALYSTAMVKNPATGEKEEVSKIVSQLKQGAAVSLSRNDVDNIVTEYGIANLRGTTIKERVKRLIAIAHPNFREQLMKEAIALGLYPSEK
ncbi:MAG: glycosyltransferase [Firmicutes bacterium]|nr:glycosyltransferase [Bacillota bacterium]